MEEGDKFLALFPHRYDFIYADVPDAGEKPNWKTESRYPLSDRAIQQGAQLFGVRFGKQTNYCLLDIDATSAYHPQRDPFAVSNIVAALEPLGLVSYLACTSSYSGGIHVYFPFQVAQSSWKVAAAVTSLLTKAGFKLLPGQLEVFPNPKPYFPGCTPSLFNAHRLPLQIGSYLLNSEFQTIWSDRLTFVQHWNFAKRRNDLNINVLKRLLQTTRKPYTVSGKAEKFLDDLNTEIEAGWTGHGQTNRLLGRIAMRAYVFHHLLAGGEPLTGQALVDEIVATARSLPGYAEWCRHQAEIEQRSAEWARCVEASRYFPYGSRPRSIKDTENTSNSIESELTWNQKQTESVRTRIQQAIGCLLETNALPSGTTARFQALTAFGISGSSLYRHRDLWHPDCLTIALEETVQTVENPPTPPTATIHSSACASGAPDDRNSTSLFPRTGCNSLWHQASGAVVQSDSVMGCNGCVDLVADRQVNRCFSHLTYAHLTHAHLTHAQRMQQFLNSGDPILVAEARSQIQQSDRAVNSWLTTTQACLTDEPAPTHWQNDRSLSSHSLSLKQHHQGLPASVDVSDLLATIAIHIRRKKWTRSQVQHFLEQRFGKSQQAFLSEMELVEWSNWLEESGDLEGIAEQVKLIENLR